MATLKNTTIDDTGFIKLPSGTTAQRPSTPTNGMWRFNTTENAQEYWNGNQWILDINPDGTTPAKAATNATQLLTYQTTSGYYWIKPTNSSTPYYVYCDQSNNGGGWMLLMNIMTNTNIHVTSNSASLSTVNSNSTVEFHSTTSYRWSTATINEFLFQSGNKVMWIEKRRNTSSTTNGDGTNGNGWFIRPGTQSQPLWPTNLECTNRATMAGSSQTDYVIYGYATATDARDNVSRSGPGEYASSNHYYPTIYPVGQSFFCAPESGAVGQGIRMATPFNTTSPYAGNFSGYLWVKIY